MNIIETQINGCFLDECSSFEHIILVYNLINMLGCEIYKSVYENCPVAFNGLLFPHADKLLFSYDEYKSTVFGTKFIIEAGKHSGMIKYALSKGIENFNDILLNKLHLNIDLEYIFKIKLDGKYFTNPWYKQLDSALCADIYNRLKFYTHSDLPVFDKDTPPVFAKVTVGIDDINTLKPYELRRISRLCSSQGEICARYVKIGSGMVISYAGNECIAAVPVKNYGLIEKISLEYAQKLDKIKGVNSVKLRIFPYGFNIKDVIKALIQ